MLRAVNRQANTGIAATALRPVAPWAVAVILFPNLVPGAMAAMGETQDAAINRDTPGFAESFDTLPLMRAIQKAEPQEYEAFRLMMQQGVQEHLTQEQLEEVAAQFAVKMTRKHLRRAKPDLLKRYLQARYKVYEQIAAVSPEVLYAYMTSGVLKGDNVSKFNRDRLRNVQQALFVDKDKAVSNLISAPPADKPLAQNADLAEKRVGEIYRKMTDAEIQACLPQGQSGVNRVAYCNLLLHFYREALKLPDKDVVLVFRLIKELPEDDRVTAK